MSQDLDTIRPKGSGNATVSDDAPIQPAQAFVDNIQVFQNLQTLNLSNKGITHFDSTLLHNSQILSSIPLGWLLSAFALWNGLDLTFGVTNSNFSIDLSGNAIPSSEVDSILDAIASCILLQQGYGPNGSINISGGTNGVPPITGLRVVCAADGGNEGSGGYLANGTLNGKPLYEQPDGHGTNNTISWSGTQWEINVVSGDGVIYTSIENVATPDLVLVWVDVLTLGSCSVTNGNVSKARCQYGAQGITWTVTTN